MGPDDWRITLQEINELKREIESLVRERAFLEAQERVSEARELVVYLETLAGRDATRLRISDNRRTDIASLSKQAANGVGAPGSRKT